MFTLCVFKKMIDDRMDGVLEEDVSSPHCDDRLTSDMSSE